MNLKNERWFLEKDIDKEYIKNAVQAENEFVEKEENEKKAISSHKKEKFKKGNDDLLKIKNKLNNVYYHTYNFNMIRSKRKKWRLNQKMKKR